MNGYDESTYGEGIASVYDEMYGEASDDEIDLLAELAGTGPVLELGIGTGRLALPLHRRGIEVEGIDGSPAMVERLHSKPDGENIAVTIGDFSDFDLPREFAMVFVAFNTFFGILDQEGQVAAFATIARHLADDGVFVMEAFVPDPARFDRNQRTSVSDVAVDSAMLEVARYQPATQRVDAQHIFLRHGQPPDVVPVRLRFAWPSELDLMGRLAGLVLRDRWGGWDRRPFGDHSTQHISVWGRAVE